MSERNYYEAYDDRYRQVHNENLQWASDRPSAIVSQVMERFQIGSSAWILEIGCGEGRDAGYLLEQGFDLLATDVSGEAVEYCKRKYARWADRFQVLDCLKDRLDTRFDFIYAVAVVHMLVEDGDRRGFYRFIRDHLTPDGAALICTMGDGTAEVRSNVDTAFQRQERTHQATGRALLLAGTSCRMVGFETFRRELAQNGLELLEDGRTAMEPDFSQMMYAVVRRKEETGAS